MRAIEFILEKNMTDDDMLFEVANTLKDYRDTVGSSLPACLDSLMGIPVEDKQFMKLVTNLAEKYRVIQFVQSWSKDIYY